MGIDFQYAMAELGNAIDFGTLCNIYESYDRLPPGTSCAPDYNLQPQQNDGSQTLTGHNWAVGYSMGMTYDFTSATRMGVSFHSATRHDVGGTSEFDNVPALFATTFTDTDAQLVFMLPESLSIGVRHTITPKLDLLADYTWTRWSRYDEVVVEFENGLPTSRSAQNWKDVPRYSLGMNYRWKEGWLIRAGASYDKTPIPDVEHRSPRVPDSDKLTLALGSQLALNETLDLEMAVTYTLPSKADIDNTDGFGHNLRGRYDVDTSYISLQLNWKL
jgi:long-chain fatty acid transport protein